MAARKPDQMVHSLPAVYTYTETHMYTEVVSLRLPPTVLAELDRRADTELRTRSNMAALLIREGLAEPTVTFIDDEEKP